MPAPITKIMAARQQLVTAIDLFFANRDPISIFSLAANAWEVVDALCLKSGTESLSAQARENVPVGKDLKRTYVNAPYRNFFKHADFDPHASLEPIPDTHLESLLFLAVEDYIRLNARSPVHLQVFQLWYLAKYPEKLADVVAADRIENVRAAFPALASLPPSRQRAVGAKAIEEALQDSVLLADPRTESAFS